MQPLNLFFQGVALGAALFVWSLLWHVHLLIALALSGWLETSRE